MHQDPRIKHGYAGSCKRLKGETATYVAWSNMRRRCKSEPAYIKRGTTVCDRWNNFSNFLVDMGEKPNGLSLDRIDNAGHYEPSNCRWATKSEQQNNLSVNIRYEYRGTRLTIGEICDRFGLKRKTISARLRYGWDIISAVELPYMRGRSFKRDQTFGS